MILIQLLYKKLFGIDPSETTFRRRSFFNGDYQTQARLEKIGETFVQGYNQSLNFRDLDELSMQLNSVEAEFQGFAFEGAAMALAMLDILTPWFNKRCQSFLIGSGANHIYLIYVGIGWAVARLSRNPGKILANLDPLLGSLVIDGYGFHEGYFYGDRYFSGNIYPRKLDSHQKRVFDQGLGRSLWFRECADLERISNTIEKLEVQRHGDLWRGIGLACAYAGGADSSVISNLLQVARTYQPQLAQGSAFAAKARQRAGNPTTHTELACNILCDLTSEKAAAIVDLALENLSPYEGEPLYESWQRHIQCLLALKEVSI